MNEAFRLGINYWPARTAMGWWPLFDRAEVAADFARIAAAGFESVRIFLTWEDFQPTAARVDPAMVSHLVTTLDEASAAGLAVMPTLFVGHMSGVNWVPPWALGGDSGDARFRVVSGGEVRKASLVNWTTDADIVRAQATLARELAAALAGHPALWAWDLGNENSNCVVPPNKERGRAWLARVSDAIRGGDPSALVTIGLHMEDLEQDRNLGPKEAAECCDFLTMHGYPGYATWADSPTDERVLSFLSCMTQWLGEGATVLFSEFGVPTHARRREGGAAVADPSKPALVSEADAAAYVSRALAALRACGSSGAMLWCHADYDPQRWPWPPLDLATHERSFGLWRSDHSPKPAVDAVRAFADGHFTVRSSASIADVSWLDVDAKAFYRAPGRELPRLFLRYCEAQLSSAP